MTAMIFAAATAPNAAKYSCNMEFPHWINSHLVEFVSNMRGRPRSGLWKKAPVLKGHYETTLAIGPLCSHSRARSPKMRLEAAEVVPIIGDSYPFPSFC